MALVQVGEVTGIQAALHNGSVFAIACCPSARVIPACSLHLVHVLKALVK